jgi:hypothetical protein
MKWKAIFVLLEVLYAGVAGIGAGYVFGRSFDLDCFTRHFLGFTVFFLSVVGKAVWFDLTNGASISQICDAAASGPRS